MANLTELFCSVQGEGPWVGERHLFVRFSACDLRCSWCDTPESLTRVDACQKHTGEQISSHTNPVPDEELRNWIQSYSDTEKFKYVALTGGEPLLQVESIVNICKESPHNFLLETGGHRHRELNEVISLLSRVSMDIKLPSSTNERPLWKEHEMSLEVLSRADIPCAIKCIVTADTSNGDIEEAAKLVADVLGNHKQSTMILQPVTEGFGSTRPSAEMLYYVQSLVMKYFHDVRVIPQTHPTLSFK